jgi:KaiC/GvpD/RAD55 family RecA-like ATPase
MQKDLSNKPSVQFMTKKALTEVFPGSSLLTEGEIPNGIYLLTGPSGSGKTSFCKTFLAKGLSNKETGIYLSTDEDCAEIQASIQKLVENEDGTKIDIRLVDAYSWRVRGTVGGVPFVTVNPADLTGVMITCQKICQGLYKPRFVFDSITNLAVQSSPETTLKFIQVVTAQMRSLSALAFFTLTPASHDSMFVSTVRTMFDGIIEMKVDDTGDEITRLFRIFSMKCVNHKTRWVAFTITEKGISIVEDSTPRCAWCGGVIPYEPHKETIEGRNYTFHATGCFENFKRRSALERFSEQSRSCSMTDS